MGSSQAAAETLSQYQANSTTLGTTNKVSGSQLPSFGETVINAYRLAHCWFGLVHFFSRGFSGIQMCNFL